MSSPGDEHAHKPNDEIVVILDERFEVIEGEARLRMPPAETTDTVQPTALPRVGTVKVQRVNRDALLRRRAPDQRPGVKSGRRTLDSALESDRPEADDRAACRPLL